MPPDSGHTLQLLRQWHGGDRGALEELVRENLPWIHAYVRKKLDQGLRRKAESLDLVQDAMVQVLELGPQFEVSDRDHFRALIARIVTNDIRDGHRWMNRQRRDQGRERPLPGDSVLHLDLPEGQVTRPSQKVYREERKAWVRLAIEFLAPDEREMIQMRMWDKASFKDIGLHFEISEDAARMRHNRALKKLADRVVELRSGGAARFLADL